MGPPEDGRTVSPTLSFAWSEDCNLEPKQERGEGVRKDDQAVRTKVQNRELDF